MMEQSTSLLPNLVSQPCKWMTGDVEEESEEDDKAIYHELQNAEVVGVSDVLLTKSCFACNGRIEPDNEKIAHCTNFPMVQRLDNSIEHL